TRPDVGWLVLAQPLIPLLDLHRLLAGRGKPRETVAETSGGAGDRARTRSRVNDTARTLCLGTGDAEIDAAQRQQAARRLVGIGAQQVAAALQQPQLLPLRPVAAIGELEPRKGNEIEDAVGGEVAGRGDGGLLL